MAGLVPAIHARLRLRRDVDARGKPEHDQRGNRHKTSQGILWTVFTQSVNFSLNEQDDRE
jgi:hypothetical protein